MHNIYYLWKIIKRIQKRTSFLKCILSLCLMSAFLHLQTNFRSKFLFVQFWGFLGEGKKKTEKNKVLCL